MNMMSKNPPAGAPGYPPGVLADHESVTHDRT